MYLKLSIRNARRSFTDYLLYIAAMMTLMSVMEISEYIAVSGDAFGFQTSSLPVLISIIQIILISFIDRFMLKQRAKEFATYLLLGMEKNRLTSLFLLEIFLIGLFCFAAGIALSFIAIFLLMADPSLSFYVQSLGHCLFYFCLVEIVCAFYLKRYLNQLQIRNLLCEKNRSQIPSFHTPDSQKLSLHTATWGIAFGICFTLFVTFILGIALLPEKYASILISLIALPLLSSVFTLYRWLFQALYTMRERQPSSLYQGSRLYLIARLTANFRTNALINAVYCICLLFSLMAFLTGILMLRAEICLFDRSTQLWMGTAQICLCIIFLVIYFFLLSLRQIMELKQSAKNLSILHCTGTEQKQLQKLVTMQIHIGLGLPMLAMIPVMLSAVPFLNWRLNFILPEALHGIILQASGGFLLCISFFYFCFYQIIRILNGNSIK